MNRAFSSRKKSRGFLLLETMLGVIIFAVGVLGMTRAVQNCLAAERLKQAAQVARLALENRMAEVESGAVAAKEGTVSEELKDQFKGITMIQTRRKFALKGGKKQELTGLYTVELEATWRSQFGDKQSRQLSFYVYLPNQ